MKKELYSLSMNNIDKKIPFDYDKRVIPEIEKVTKHIPGDVLKLKIYNYLIYYYNKNILSGIMPSIFVHTTTGTKRIYYNISKETIIIKLISEVK